METDVIDVAIDAYGKPGDRDAFAQLNLYWLEAYFVVEDEDRRILNDPETSILGKGGHIFMARVDGKAVGTGALIHIDDEVCEFAKMGVATSHEGRGIGRKILVAALDAAKAQGYAKVLICTSSKLGAANHLYQSAGFVPSTDARHHAYDRADVFWERGL